MSTASTSSNTDMCDSNRELNTYKDRPALELTSCKKQLETQSRIEVESAKQNLKTQFGHELRQQTLIHTKTIESLRQQINQLGEQLQQQQAAPNTQIQYNLRPNCYLTYLYPHHPLIKLRDITLYKTYQ